MTKKKVSKKTSLKKEVAKLKKEKAKALILKKKLLSRKKEMEELRELQREVKELKGVGTKSRVAAQLTKKIGTDAGKFGWKSLKAIGKASKKYLENQARQQDAAAARARKNRSKKK